MSFSYGARPFTNPVDAVRLRLGDIFEDEPLFQDEEIQYFLQLNGGSVLAAALAGARNLMSLWVRLVDERAGQVAVNLSQRMGNVEKLIEALEMEMVMEGDGNYVFTGGVSEVANQELISDSDAVQPAFTTTLFQTYSLDSEDAGGGNNDNLAPDREGD
jgi:hypothetical protein